MKEKPTEKMTIDHHHHIHVVPSSFIKTNKRLIIIISIPTLQGL